MKTHYEISCALKLLNISPMLLSDLSTSAGMPLGGFFTVSPKF